MLKAYPVHGKQKSADICAAFIAGAPADAEGAVFYGVNESNAADWIHVVKRGEPFVYLDNSYFDATRGTYFRATLNAMQHRGLGPSTCLRLRQQSIAVKPWISDVGRRPEALVLEQSPAFLRVLHGRDAGEVSRLMINTARRAGLHATIRPWNSDKPKQVASFAQQLRGACRVLAFSSAGAVQAAIEGVPFCVLDPLCAAARFSTPPHRLGSNPVMPHDADRLTWLGVLADNQWTLDEMRAGLAWQTINKTRNPRNP